MTSASLTPPPHLTRPFAKHGILLVDRIGLIIAIYATGFAITDAAIGDHWAAAICFATAALNLGIRALNGSGRHRLAAVAMIVTENATIFICSALHGKAMLIQNLFFPAIALPLLICGEVTPGVVAGTLLPVALYGWLEATRFEPFGPHFHLYETAVWKPIAVVAACFAVSFIFVFEFFRIARVIEEGLRNERNKLLAASKFSALGEMAGGIAHEINNPLANILLLSAHVRNLAQKPEIPREAIQQCADNIQATVKRISCIVRSLSTFSRNTERDPMTRENVTQIVHETCGMCLEKFSNHGVELRVSLGAPSASIECNAVQISQILVNLLNNAFDAVRDSPERWVQLEAIDRDDRVELSVTDSGPGIPLEARNRLFEPFFTTKPAGHGTGLGLSVSANIARAHQGELTLDPLCANTRFKLILPKAQRCHDDPVPRPLASPRRGQLGAVSSYLSVGAYLRPISRKR